MESTVAAQYQSALASFSVPNQHRILEYLALLAARHYTAATLAAVVNTLNARRRQVTEGRQRVLSADLPQTTSQDIVACRTAAQASGLAPSTIKTKLGLLSAFFEPLRAEGQMTQQPGRRRHRLRTPTGLPTPLPDADLTAFFQVIDAVRDRLIFLCMLRCG
jgi:site-specific recombinase XerD